MVAVLLYCSQSLLLTVLMVLEITKLSMHLTFTEDKMCKCLSYIYITTLDVGASFNAVCLLSPKDL